MLRVGSLVSASPRSHQRAAEVEDFVSQLESQSQIPQETGPAKDLHSDLCEWLSSIQHDLETVTISIHSFAQLANSMQSRYSKLIDHPPFSCDYSIPTIFKVKLTEFGRQRAHLRTRRAQLKAKYDELSQHLQELEQRELAAHESLCDPLNDCPLEERAVEKLETKLDDLRLKLRDVQNVHPLKKVPSVDFHLRRAEIRTQLAEIQIAKQELGKKSYFIPLDRAPQDEEDPYSDLEKFYEKGDE
jgi:DNA repair exonuclease SbcCD ATPase subunit